MRPAVVGDGIFVTIFSLDVFNFDVPPTGVSYTRTLLMRRQAFLAPLQATATTVAVTFAPFSVFAETAETPVTPPPAALEVIADDAPFDINTFPGDVIEDVIVPVPSEIFEVLDELGQPNWRAEMRPQANANLSDRYEIALQFGVVVADGFIAVQAEDQQTVQNLGREVLDLAGKLGLRDAVLQHATSIDEGAKKGDFEAVRQELDRTQSTVRNEMKRLRDSELAQCVSIGGWLRGTEVVTSLISKSYSAEKAELLNQPGLVDHFIAAVGAMKPKVRETETMVEVKDGLEAIQSAMRPTGEETVIASDAVGEMLDVSSKLVHRVTGDKPAVETPPASE